MCTSGGILTNISDAERCQTSPATCIEVLLSSVRVRLFILSTCHKLQFRRRWEFWVIVIALFYYSKIHPANLTWMGHGYSLYCTVEAWSSEIVGIPGVLDSFADNCCKLQIPYVIAHQFF